MYDGLEKAVNENYDVVLIDTAGRLQNKENRTRIQLYGAAPSQRRRPGQLLCRHEPDLLKHGSAQD